MDATRTLFAALGISALVVSAACDQIAGESHPLSASPAVATVTTARPSADADAPEAAIADETLVSDAGAPDTGVAAPAAGTYEAMCLHYCATLEQTLLYACLVRGADDCAATSAGTTTRCLDARCAQRLVQPPACLGQCDALESFQSTYCQQVGGGPACVAAAATQDDTCRQACAVTTP
jgi:hypothetical protein